MSNKTDHAWEYTSPLGTKLQLARLKSGHNATREYLKASFGNGSYPSSSTNPLFAVQIGLIPVFGDTIVPLPLAQDYGSCLLNAAGKFATDTAKVITANAVAAGKALAAHQAPPAPMPVPAFSQASPYSTFNLSQDEASPATQNDTTSTTVSWGISVGASVAKDPSGTLGGDFSTSETRNISDMQVYDQIWNTPQNGQAFGTIWQLVFTRKDGMNLSSFQPRCDVLYSAPPGSLDGGTLHYLLVEVVQCLQLIPEIYISLQLECI